MDGLSSSGHISMASSAARNAWQPLPPAGQPPPMDTFGSARGANSGVGGAASSAATRGHVADLEAQLAQVSSMCSILVCYKYCFH